MINTDVLIIGAGPAGCSAAAYTVRAGLKTIILGGAMPGGQLLQTNDIENYMGFVEPISGFELMDKMHKQVTRLGAQMLRTTALKIDSSKKPFTVTASDGQKIEALSIIIATGSAARWLGIEGEEQYKGKGISACATCDGFFFKGKAVCVVGGGNTAFEDALFLSNFCTKVYIIHRRDGFRAHQNTVDKVKGNPKIEMLLCSVVEKLHGDGKGLTSVTVRSVVDDSERVIDCSGLFVAIGSVPQTAFIKDGPIELERDGYVKIDAKMRTTVEGIYAAGDCADNIYRQASIAAGAGAKAAIEAISYVNIIK